MVGRGILITNDFKISLILNICILQKNMLY